MPDVFLPNPSFRERAYVKSLEEYEKLIEIFEEYEDIKDFDERMKDPEWESFDEVNRRLRVPD